MVGDDAAPRGSKAAFRGVRASVSGNRRHRTAFLAVLPTEPLS